MRGGGAYGLGLAWECEFGRIGGFPAERGKRPDLVAVVVGGDALTPAPQPLEAEPLEAEPLEAVELAFQLKPLSAPLLAVVLGAARLEADEERTESPRPLARPNPPSPADLSRDGCLALDGCLGGMCTGGGVGVMESYMRRV